MSIIREFEKITTEYRNSVNPGIASMAEALKEANEKMEDLI